nr:hypothetical protein [Carnobacterium sp. ISL-102]
MNSKTLSFVKNFSYALSSNLISLIISTIVVLVVPKLIGIEEYGYWQLYIFYTSYIGFLHFGWNDGIYLRYGGEIYKNLDKNKFFSQYYMLVISQIIIATFFGILAYFFVNDSDKKFIFEMIAIAIVVVNSRYMLLFILQATNRIKEYSNVTILDRVFYVGMLIFLLQIGIRNYRLMIAADVLGKCISLFYAMYLCRDIVYRKLSDFTIDVKEVFANINVGIKLMFSNIASKFVIGFIRLGIEKSWDIGTFGKISLTLSVSNLMMLFVNAMGIIIYPVLRRTNQEKLSGIYSTLRDSLMIILLGILIVFYPFKIILSEWLPAYAESLDYMGILFPIVIFESKMSLLINSYLKTLRKERVILLINVITVSLSTILTIITTVFLKNLDLAIFSIVILLAFRGIIAEMFLSKMITIKVTRDIILELLMTSIFIYSAWVVNSSVTPLIYGLAYLGYLFVKRNDFKVSLRKLKSLIKE